MCKKHYLDFVKCTVRKEIQKIYRDPESAYAALDFSGKGRISMQDFLKGLVVQRLKFDIEVKIDIENLCIIRISKRS